MELAFDTFQNQLVYAVDCDRSGYFTDRYICPCCEETLIFAAGAVQTAHFKHRASAPECENRVAAMAKGPFSNIESEPRDAALVALFTNRNGEKACSFVLRYMPTSNIDSISIKIGQHNIPYRLHGHHKIDIPVSAIAKNYFISAIVSGRVIFQHTIQAFGRRPVIFRHTTTQAASVPGSRSLHPGQYIACFPPDIPLQFPLICEPREVHCKLGIKIVSFKIPDHLNNRILSFCRDSLGMSVTIRPFSYAILEPMALGEEAPDVWTTSTEGNASILIGSKSKTGISTTLTMQYREGARLLTQIEQITFSEKPRIFSFALGKRRPLIRLGIGTPVQFITELRYLDLFPEPVTTRFHFKFCDETSGKELQLCRSSWLLPQKLAEVRQGKLVVASIEYPKSVKLELLNDVNRVAILGKNEGEILTKFLRESKGGVCIDAHGYPPIFVPAKAMPRPKAVKVDLGRTRRHPIQYRRRQLAAYKLGVGSRYSAFAQ